MHRGCHESPQTLHEGWYGYKAGKHQLKGRSLYYNEYYYNLSFNYAFYTLVLNIRAWFNFKSCPIPYGLEGGYPPVIISHV